MATDISEVYSAEALVGYYNTVKSGGDVHYSFLGEQFFPTLKHKGLRIDFVKGFHGAPAELRPSALDSNSFQRPRIPVDSVQTKIPFFKESMAFGEEERQDLADLLRLHGQDENFVMAVMRRYYKDYADLVAGADVSAEKMRMSLLAFGKIDVACNKDGQNIDQTFDFDTTGAWTANNTVTLSGTSTWTDANKATNDPIKDITDAIKRHRIQNGVITARILMNSETFNRIAQSESVKKAIRPLGGNILDSEIEAYIQNATKAQLILNDAIYKNLNGVNSKYYPDGKVTLLPSYTLGFTNYGTTPTEFDILNGNNSLHSHAIYNEGVCVYTHKTVDPVNIKTVVEQLALPSFEEMDSVYVMNVFSA